MPPSPELYAATQYGIELEAGEMIFVPGGSAHQVRMNPFNPTLNTDIKSNYRCLGTES